MSRNLKGRAEATLNTKVLWGRFVSGEVFRRRRSCSGRSVASRRRVLLEQLERRELFVVGANAIPMPIAPQFDGVVGLESNSGSASPFCTGTLFQDGRHVLTAAHCVIDNEEQIVDLGAATGGTFQLSFQGQSTGNLAFNLSANDLRTALEGLTTINAGNVQVFSNPDDDPATRDFTVRFIDALGVQNVPQLVGVDNLTGDTLSITTSDQGGMSNFDGVFFELSDGIGGSETVSIDVRNVIPHPQYNGFTDNGNDVAVLELAEIAPIAADRHDVFRGNNEVGQVFTLVGYGLTGVGNTGLQDGSGGTKRSGQNRWDAFAQIVAGAPVNAADVPPAGTALTYDFDNGAAANDFFGTHYALNDTGLGVQESMQSRGDSGGPAFIGTAISGIVSYSRQRFNQPPDVDGEGNNTFGEYAVMNRASAFATWFDANTDPSGYTLVLDLNNHQTEDGLADIIEIRTVGVNVQVLLNGALLFEDQAAQITGIEINGTNDAEMLIVDANVGSVVFDGAGGADSVFVHGSDNAETATLDVVGGNPRLTIGGSTIEIRQTESLSFLGHGGADRLIVDSTNGLISLAGGINFDGGLGFDGLDLRQTGGTARTNSRVNVGAKPGDGQSIIDTQVVNFFNLEPVTDNVAAANFTIGSVPGIASLLQDDNQITYTEGTLMGNTWGRVTVDNFEPIEFRNKTNLTIDAGSGSDEISTNNALTPTGLTTITIEGGNPTAGSDLAIVSATTGNDTIVFAVTTDDDAVITGAGPVPITLTTIEKAFIDGQGGSDTLRYQTPAAADIITFEPTGDGSSGLVSAVRGTSGVLMDLQFDNLFSIGTPLTFEENGGGKTDLLHVIGTPGNDRFNVTAAGAISASSNQNNLVMPSMATTGVARLSLYGLDGDDTFTVASNHPFAAGLLQIEGGNPDNGSDVLNFNGAGAAITADLAARTVAETGFGAVVYVGIETINIAAAAAALTATLTNNDDVLTYRPAAVGAGSFQNAGDNTTYNFSGVAGTFLINEPGLANNADTVIVEGTNNRDRFSIASTTAIVSVTDFNGVLRQPATLTTGVETVRAVGLAGNDTFLVEPAPTVAGFPAGSNLLVEIDGGGPGASDALVIATAAGAALPATDFAVNAVGLNPGEGRVRVYRNAVAMPDISYTNVEIVSPRVVVTNGVPQLLVLGPDASEPNEFRTTAMHLGAGDTINVDNLGIFPDAAEHPNVPADEDFFQIIAEATGTIDVIAWFEVYQATLLPGGGQLGLQVLDSNGNVIGGAGTFGSPDATANARVRFPAVAGQPYFIRVFGANADGTANTAVVNGYELSIINTAAPVPFDLELADQLYSNTVDGAPATTATTFSTNPANFAPIVPQDPTPVAPADDFFNGKYVNFLTGPQAGQRYLIADYVAATGTFTITGSFRDNPATAGADLPAVGDQFVLESIDTGRSQFDNVTRDITPTIFIRVPDAVLLNDVPDNGAAPGAGIDEAIAIPFVSDTSINVPNAAAPRSGFRVAVFVTEENTHTPVGFAQPVDAVNLPGVYAFTFPAGLTPDGSYSLSARLEMIDPAAAEQAQGFGGFAQSLEIVVDTTAPNVSFGDPSVATDGLHPASDSGVPYNPATLVDRATNDTTPTFFGRAEANSVIRLYVDRTNNGFTADDLLIGQTVATPLDGTNQHPFGEWELTSSVNMNDPLLTANIGLDGLRQIYAVAEDSAGNLTPTAAAQTLQIFVDTQGPQITNVFITGRPDFNLFSVKSLANAPQGPTPPIRSLTINVRDLPARAAGFLLEALGQLPPGGVNVPLTLPAVVLQGDHAGIIPVQSATVTSDGNLNDNFPPVAPEPDPLVVGQPATAFITLVFAEPLPDDRFTLTISDSLTDPLGNALDGENNAAEPVNAPNFPTGDRVPGGDFVARFTVDSRPEIGVVSQAAVYVDINGNMTFDPDGADNDETNRDFVYLFGLISDAHFAGNFSAVGGAASGYDKLGAYGRFGVGNEYSFIIDTNDDGVGDVAIPMPNNPLFRVNGIPVAGNFSNAKPGDEIGLFDGTAWIVDLNGNNAIELNERIPTNYNGLPIVGDFNGDGFDDFAVYNNDTNTFIFDTNRNGTANFTMPIRGDLNRYLGVSGFTDRPVAGDLNLDGIDDIGIWVKGRDGVLPENSGEYFFWLSDRVAAAPNVNTNPDDLFDEFSPDPLGNDLFAKFGNHLALPIFGNFDPPVGNSISTDDLPSMTNRLNPNDVNGDGAVTPIDALAVVNALNRGIGSLPMNSAARMLAVTGGRQLDTSGDGRISPLDALRVINTINRTTRGEGEFTTPTFSAAAIDLAMQGPMDDLEDELFGLFGDSGESSVN